MYASAETISQLLTATPYGYCYLQFLKQLSSISQAFIKHFSSTSDTSCDPRHRASEKCRFAAPTEGLTYYPNVLNMFSKCAIATVIVNISSICQAIVKYFSGTS
jgi:hypothetical protein